MRLTTTRTRFLRTKVAGTESLPVTPVPFNPASLVELASQKWLKQGVDRNTWNRPHSRVSDTLSECFRRIRSHTVETAVQLA